MTSALAFVALGAVVALIAVVLITAALRRTRRTLPPPAPATLVTPPLADRQQYERDAADRRCVGEGETATLMVVVDDLERLTERFGPAATEAVLELTQAALQSAIRADDVPYRFASDEFCVLVHDADDDALACVARRVTGAIHRETAIIDATVECSTEAIAVQSSRVTVSITARADTHVTVSA